MRIKREIIPIKNLDKVTYGQWTRDGEYFVYTKSNSGYVEILNDENKELDLLSENSIFAWTIDSDLLFLTNQKYSQISKPQRKIRQFLKYQIQLFCLRKYEC